jgi:hypothetical protein
MRSKADVDQVLLTNLELRLTRLIDGRTPNSSVFAMADGPMPSCLSALTRKKSMVGLRPL